MAESTNPKDNHTAGEAEKMVAIAQSFGSFGTYADEATSNSLGEDLPQRFDVGINYFDQGLDGAGNTHRRARISWCQQKISPTVAFGGDVALRAI